MICRWEEGVDDMEGMEEEGGRSSLEFHNDETGRGLLGFSLFERGSFCNLYY